jgi:hypothetical protein
MQISADVLVGQARAASELNIDLAPGPSSEPLATLCIAAVAHAQGVRGMVLAAIGRRLARNLPMVDRVKGKLETV